MAKSSDKIVLQLPKKQLVELTPAQAEDVMVQLLRYFGPPPPVLVPMQQTGQIQAQYTGQMPFQLAGQITGRN